MFGNAVRNSLRGPGFFQGDVSVAKVIPLKEKVSLQFRADIFTLFNTVNLDLPQTCVDCQTGGMIYKTTFWGTALQRQMMFSLKLQFLVDEGRKTRLPLFSSTPKKTLIFFPQIFLLTTPLLFLFFLA